MIVVGEHLDSDLDGLLDHWETTGIDLDGDGGVDLDLAAMGANPFARDLFLQIDWTADRPAPLNFGDRHRPVAGMLRKLAQFYASAPALPNGVPAGIQLHVDAGAGKDPAQQFFSRNMGIGPLVGGQTVAGGPVDILYGGLPASVAFPGVNAVSFDTVKRRDVLEPSSRCPRVRVHADRDVGLPSRPVRQREPGAGNRSAGFVVRHRGQRRHGDARELHELGDQDHRAARARDSSARSRAI